MPTIRTILEVIGIIAAAILLWFDVQKPVAAPASQPQAAQKAPEVASVAKTEINPPKVVVYAPEAKKKLNLPAPVQSDQAVAVLDSSIVPDSNHPQTVTTVIDATTGESKTFVTTDPYPWIAGENEKEVRISYGVKNGLLRVGRISFTDDLVQIKALHFGVTLSLDSDLSYFAGVGIGYKW